MNRLTLALILAASLGAGKPTEKPQEPPSVDLYISDLQAQVDSLRMRVEALEGKPARRWIFGKADSAVVRVRCHAQTKAGRQCKRMVAAPDSICTQHRRMAK